MNMKMDDQANETMDQEIQKRNRYTDRDDSSEFLNDINDNNFDIDLPEGAKAGLKDATQDMQLNTKEMNE